MSDYEHFDFDQTQRTAWDEFSLRLDEVLSVMDSSADLTISVDATADAELRPGIRFTMVGDATVGALATLSAGSPTEAELRRMTDLGWERGDDGIFHAESSQEASGHLAELATNTLADVFGVLHPVFLEPDQLAEILQGQAPWATLTPRKLSRNERSLMPGSRAELDSLVDDELRRVFGHPPMRNEQGDVAIRVGSTVVFLRSTPDAAELVLFSALVHDVAGRSRAAEVLNDLNVESRYGRFALHRDRVFVQLSVPAQPFVPAHLHQALRALSQIADGIDDELATKLGGRTTYGSGPLE